VEKMDTRILIAILIRSQPHVLQLDKTQDISSANTLFCLVFTGVLIRFVKDLKVRDSRTVLIL